MNVQSLIGELFEHDILITPEQAKLLTEQDAALLKDLLKHPREAEQYLASLVARAYASKNSVQTSQAPAASTSQNKSSSQSSTQSSSQSQSSAPEPTFTARSTSAIIPVQIIQTYDRKPKKRSYQDFVQHMGVRFQAVERFLRARKELAAVMSIDRTKRTNENNGKVVLIGIVLEKRETKNEHIIIELEDKSGTVNVLFSKNKPELISIAQDINVDDVVGVTGSLKEDIVFADGLYIPDIPMQHETKKCPEEVYAVCISDIHFGNKNFMKKEFDDFLAWLHGNAGTPEARRIAARTKYVFIPGDVIEGVGIYPSQEGDLSIPDIYDQYKYCDDVLSAIPEDKHVFIIPGNHDIGRLSEPQPRLQKDILPKLWARPNTYMLSNPSTVKIHEMPGFPGFTILLYHGSSFIYYANQVPRLFKEGSASNPCAVMQYLLQRRHLAPAHASALYVPDIEEDQLVITEIPDFFISGHLHTTQHKTWRGISMLSCSCWVPITEYQLKQGLKVDPGKFMLINLQSRQIEMLKPSDLFDEEEIIEKPTSENSVEKNIGNKSENLEAH